MSRIVNDQNHPPIMDNESFWISEDGVISSVKGRPKSKVLDLTVTFRLNKKAEIEWARSRLKKIQFTERSSLARWAEIAKRPPSMNRDRLILSCEAFSMMARFPVPRTTKNSSSLAHRQVAFSTLPNPKNCRPTKSEPSTNLIKLPNTTSIDRLAAYFSPTKFDTPSQNDI